VQIQRQSDIGDQDATDTTLVQLALQGDQQAFEALVSRYKQPLFDLIYHYVGEYYEAEDILQHVYLKLYLSLSTLEPNQNLRPWLFTVARNRCLDFLRHKRAFAGRLLFFSEVSANIGDDDVAIFDMIPDAASTPEELVEQRGLQREIRHAIQSLPQVYRSVVWLLYKEQLNYDEIGQILAMSASTIKTRFNRAKPYLRAILDAP